jgi:hypothetical protein
MDWYCFCSLFNLTHLSNKLEYLIYSTNVSNPSGIFKFNSSSCENLPFKKSLNVHNMSFPMIYNHKCQHDVKCCVYVCAALSSSMLCNLLSYTYPCVSSLALDLSLPFNFIAQVDVRIFAILGIVDFQI